MKVGIFGGTFDPFHRAHLETALGACRLLALDRILLTVSADPPHKNRSDIVSAEIRLEMVRLAVTEYDALHPSDIEIRRDGKSYTALTLRELTEKMPGAELYLIIGSDSLQQIASWYEPETVTSLATLAVVPREGCAEKDAEAAAALTERFGAKIVTLLLSVPGFSSTEIRSRIAAGLPVGSMLPPAVEDMICKQGLYLPDDVRALSEKVRSILFGHEKRFLHTLAVVRRAAELAEKHGADPGKARVAAFVHDVAKYLPEELLVSLSGENVIYSAVLHAFAGPAVIREKLGIEDEEILEAVRLHSTGDAAMTPLAMLLYLADMTEDTRDFPAVHVIRAAADRSLTAGMYVALRYTLLYLHERHSVIHPATYRAYNYYKTFFEGGNPMDDVTKIQAEQLAKVLYDKKGVDIIGIPVSEKTVVAEWFLIASGRSVTQVRSLADELEDKGAELGLKPLRKEGYDEGRWIVLDYGSILVHLFYPEERKYYSIERLWDTDGNAVHFSELWDAADKAAEVENLRTNGEI